MVMLLILSLSIGFAENKADELNKLQILRGDGTDYMLEQRLTRAQALTFVVRLVGGESLVLKRAELFKNSGFEDVNPNAWYAPYVGYAKGFRLIEGYEDGTFKPEAYLSEREFYAMVLNALKIDYEWENIESIAYENNIIKEKDDENNAEYLRASVVDVLYQTLDSRKELIDQLVDSGIVSLSDVQNLMVYKTDEIKTEIKRVSSTDQYTVHVVLNEPIQSVNVEISDGIVIEETKVSDKDLYITTGALTPGKEYTIKLTDLVDLENFKMDQLEETFEGYEKKEITSNHFLISKIEPQSKNLIHVYFTHPVTISAEIQFNYDLYADGELFVEGNFENIEVSKLGESENAVGIWFKEETLIDGKKYELKIDGDLTSQYFAKLDSGNGDSASFYADGSQNGDLEIVSFKPYDTGIIRVVFNKDLDSSSATKLSNYTLDSKFGDIMPSGIEFTGDGNQKYRQIDIRITPISAVDGNDEKVLTMENIKDSYKAAEIKKEQIEFNDPIEADADVVEIDSVEAINKGLVNIYLDRGIVAPSNSDINNIVISNASVMDDMHIFESRKPYMIQLFLDSSNYLNNGTHTMTIFANTFEDSLGRSNEEVDITFNGSTDDIPELRFSEAYFIEKNKVLVEYNYPVDTTSAGIAGNYRLKYDDDGDTEYINASSVGQIDSRRFAISFSSVSSSEDYKIEADNIKDHSGENTTNDISKSVEK